MSDFFFGGLLGFLAQLCLQKKTLKGGDKTTYKKIDCSFHKYKNTPGMFREKAEEIGKCLSTPNGSFFKLPVRTVTIIPSTQSADQPISKKSMRRRVHLMYNFLAKTFGGFSATKVVGGYLSNDDNKLIKEEVVAIESFATTEAYNKNVDKWLAFVAEKGQSWGQEAMGVVVEDDMFYIGTKIA